MHLEGMFLAGSLLISGVWVISFSVEYAKVENVHHDTTWDFEPNHRLMFEYAISQSP